MPEIQDVVLALVLRPGPDGRTEVAILQSRNAPYSRVGFPYLQKEGWIFPGGRVEPQEDVLAAAKREVHEELGLTVQPLAVALERQRGPLRLHYVVCMVDSPDQQPQVMEPEKHLACMWRVLGLVHRHVPSSYEVQALVDRLMDVACTPEALTAAIQNPLVRGR